MDVPAELPAGIAAWVAQVAELTRPERIHCCDGSEDEYHRLCAELVAAGTFTALDPERRPGSYVARSDPADTARVEDRTFICTRDAAEAGPNNNWREPEGMKAELRSHFADSMRGRTMYVIPFAMAPLDSPVCTFGVQITDSPYVVVHMRIMSRMGRAVLDTIGDRPWVPCLHSVGAPLEPGSSDVPWPCDPDNKYIVHFPEEPAIWSYGSGYGGNALLGKKCLALRIASCLARRQGWLAEHMLILRLTSPAGKRYHIAAAFPSQCGKTNLAMIEPTIPGWRAECLGDDIAWLHVDDEGFLRAVNPEAGFFGVAPGTGWDSNPVAMRTITHDTLFTNVAIADDGDAWWEGKSEQPPNHCIDWRGRDWSPEHETKAAHPNARYTVAAAQCPTIAADWEDPAGVALDAILFGGRRSKVVPLIHEAEDWRHGVFLGATCASRTTAAAEGKQGALRMDPFAMLPFCGYHMGDYIGHWLAMGERVRHHPRFFYVNWFRTDQEGNFLWPGFGENSRLLAWICRRCDGAAEVHDSPIGPVPKAEDLENELRDSGIDRDRVNRALRVDAGKWQAELSAYREYFARFADRLPDAIEDLMQELEERLASAAP